MDQMTQATYSIRDPLPKKRQGWRGHKALPGLPSGSWTRVITSTGKQIELFNNALDLLVAKI
jgi:hypothetical protein